MSDSDSRSAICPKCGQLGECGHLGDANKMGTHYYDLYAFRCANPECKHQEIQEIYGGDSHGDNWKTTCPFCGEKYPVDYNTPPDEPFDPPE